MDSLTAYKILRIIEVLDDSDVQQIKKDDFNSKFLKEASKSLNEVDRKRLLNEFSCECESCMKYRCGDKNAKGVE